MRDFTRVIVAKLCGTDAGLGITGPKLRCGFSQGDDLAAADK
jgi:hypothetical protein